MAKDESSWRKRATAQSTVSRRSSRRRTLFLSKKHNLPARLAFGAERLLGISTGWLSMLTRALQRTKILHSMLVPTTSCFNSYADFERLVKPKVLKFSGLPDVESLGAWHL